MSKMVFCSNSSFDLQVTQPWTKSKLNKIFSSRIDRIYIFFQVLNISPKNWARIPKPMLQLKLWKVKQCIYYRVHPKVYFCQKLVFTELNHIRVIAFLFPYIRSHSKLICDISRLFAIKKSQSFCFLLKVRKF